MPAKVMKVLHVRTRRDWRNWLKDHHCSESGIWLVFHKGRTHVQSIGYNDAVEEALCFGWIDSLVKRLDDERYARKFTPRKAGSRWSSINRRRYAGLKARGLLAAAGLKRSPTNRSGDAPRPSASAIPAYFEKRLKTVPRARDYFERLAPSYRRAYIGWIESAKLEETRERRLRETMRLLAAGRKLGLK